MAMGQREGDEEYGNTDLSILWRTLGSTCCHLLCPLTASVLCIWPPACDPASTKNRLISRASMLVVAWATCLQVAPSCEGSVHLIMNCRDFTFHSNSSPTRVPKHE